MLLKQTLPVGAILLGTALTALSVAQTPPARVPEETPRDIVDAHAALARAPLATIRAGGLSASIALPDPVKGFYRGTRFDWAGMITEVRLGEHRFYGPWFTGIAPNIRDYVDDGRTVIAGPQTAATGPAEEFVGAAPNPTPGFADAPVGGTFVKIGVGRLRKANADPYNRFRPYEIVDGGRWTTRKSASAVAFHQLLAPDASGYGYSYDKAVRLKPGGVLEITHRLRNIGTKPIATQVYNHNFTRFDDRDIQPGVSVGFPYPLPAIAVGPEFATVRGNGLRYDKPLAANDHVTLSPQAFTSDPKTSGFSIASADGATVSVTGDTPIARTMLWSVRRVVAVEPFIAIDLPPGAEKSWTWRYQYSVAAQSPKSRAGK